MDWKHIKLISLAVGAILLALLSFVIGVSFGVTFKQDTFTDVLVPILSAMGSWVAGLGALAAVFTSLWLAEQQRKNSGEKLNCVFDVFVFPPNLAEKLAVNVTCTGNKPSNINSITIHSTGASVAMTIAQFDPAGHHLPIALPYGQQAGFILPQNSEASINDYVKNHCSGSYKSLFLSVNTTTNSFKVKFGKNVVKHLQK